MTFYWSFKDFKQSCPSYNLDRLRQNTSIVKSSWFTNWFEPPSPPYHYKNVPIVIFVTGNLRNTSIEKNMSIIWVCRPSYWKRPKYVTQKSHRFQSYGKVGSPPPALPSIYVNIRFSAPFFQLTRSILSEMLILWTVLQVSGGVGWADFYQKCLFSELCCRCREVLAELGLVGVTEADLSALRYIRNQLTQKLYYETDDSKWWWGIWIILQQFLIKVVHYSPLLCSVHVHCKTAGNCKTGSSTNY